MGAKTTDIGRGYDGADRDPRSDRLDLRSRRLKTIRAGFRRDESDERGELFARSPFDHPFCR